MRWTFGLALVVLSGCGGSSAAPLSFESGERCKSAETTGVLPTGHETSELWGQTCVAWELEGEVLSVDLVNLPHTCGFPNGDAEQLFVGEVRRGEGVQLAVTWDFEGVNACGGCLWDFAFELEAPELPTELRVHTRVPNTARWGEPVLAVTVADPSGIVCEAAPADP